MRLGSTSITVTGRACPSSVKIRVIPALRPTTPIAMFHLLSVRGSHPLWPMTVTHTNTGMVLAEADLNVYTCCQVQFHQSIHCLFRWLNDVEQTLVGTNFILITRVFVDVRRDQYRVLFLARRQRNRTTHLSAGPLCGIDDLLRGLVDQAIIKRLQPDSNLLALHDAPNSTSSCYELADLQKKEPHCMHNTQPCQHH